MPIGHTIEEARRNFTAKARDEPTPHPLPQSRIVIRTVRDVGDAYCEWLHSHKKSPRSIDDTVRACHAIIKL